MRTLFLEPENGTSRSPRYQFHFIVLQRQYFVKKNVGALLPSIDISCRSCYALDEKSCGGHFFMKQHSVPKFLDNFLTRTLSGTVFSWREILHLTFPNVLDCLSVMFISMLITALISSNGEASVAAVSLVTPLTWMITCIFNGISAGGTVVVAQSCGMKDPVRIRKAAGMTLWLTVAVGTVVLMFPRQVLTLLYPEAEAVVLEKARIYLSGSAWSILVFTIYTANFGILRGLGESGRCLALSVIINAAYLVFSILFLNVLRMDILGSVFALLLARFIGAAASVILLFFWKAPVKMTFGQIFTCDKGILRSTLQVSIPLGLEQACSSLGNVVAEMYMISLGTTALATHAIANSVIGVWYSPAMAAANLSVTVVGRCFGAEKYDEAKRYGVRCDQIALILVLLTSALFIPLLPALLGQYHPTPEVLAMAKKLLYWSIPSLLLFWPRSNTLPSTLRAANDTLYPSVVSLAVLWIVTIGLGYALAIPCKLGLLGVWIAMWASWAIRCVVFSVRFGSGKWLHKALTSR